MSFKSRFFFLIDSVSLKKWLTGQCMTYFSQEKKKNWGWCNQEGSTVMVIFRKTKGRVSLHQVNTELKLHKLTEISAPLCVRSGGAYGEWCLEFASKFLLCALFSLCCGCHGNISWGRVCGFVWLGKSSETGGLLRTGWISVPSFCVGCQQPPPRSPKRMHSCLSCLLKPDRCFGPFACVRTSAYHKWRQLLSRITKVYPTIPDVWDIATYLDRVHKQLLKK